MTSGAEGYKCFRCSKFYLTTVKSRRITGVVFIPVTVMRIITTTIILILLAICSSCSRKGQEEKEPNNSFAESNAVVPDTAMTGYMNSANDRDYFVLDAVPGSIYDIQLSGVKGINCSIVIWKGYDEPKLVKWIDDNRKSSPERFANLSATGGTYYIEILESDRDPKKENRETPYELRVKAREAISEETEPNDSKEEAGPLTPDREVTGFFSPAYNRGNENKDNLHREEDWYMFEANLASDSPALADATLSR